MNNYRITEKLGNMLEIQYHDEDSVLFTFKENIKPIDKITFGYYLFGNETKIRYNKKLGTITVFRDNATQERITDNDEFETGFFVKILEAVVNYYFYLKFSDHLFRDYKEHFIFVKKITINDERATAFCNTNVIINDCYCLDFIDMKNAQEYVEKHFSPFGNLEIVEENERRIEYNFKRIL